MHGLRSHASWTMQAWWTDEHRGLCSHGPCIFYRPCTLVDRNEMPTNMFGTKEKIKQYFQIKNKCQICPTSLLVQNVGDVTVIHGHGIFF